MKNLRLFCTAALAALVLPTMAQQQPRATSGSAAATAPGQGGAIASTRIEARVEAIDKAARTLTLKGPSGRVVTLPAGPEVRNFDRIEVGDMVNVEYTEALALELKPGSGIRERVESAGAVGAPEGSRPAGVVGQRLKIVAEVVSVDSVNRTVRLRGPQGGVVDLVVRDPAQFARVKVGDQVEATYAEAIAVAVEPSGAKR